MTTENKKMNQNKILPLTMGVIILSLLIVIVIQAQQLSQWTHPTAQPPMGNIQMPISGWTDDGTTVRLTTITDNVGIGTATPATRLHVEGTTRTTGFQLGTTATPGHVLTTNAAGVGTWQAAAPKQKEWRIYGDCAVAQTYTVGCPSWPSLNVPSCPAGWEEVGYYDQSTLVDRNLLLFGLFLPDADLSCAIVADHLTGCQWCTIDARLTGVAVAEKHVCFDSPIGGQGCLLGHCAYRICRK